MEAEGLRETEGEATCSAKCGEGSGGAAKGATTVFIDTTQPAKGPSVSDPTWRIAENEGAMAAEVSSVILL